ncbi:MAG: hypothetical protein ABI690_36335, partial [Chloroflexota bacterium]
LIALLISWLMPLDVQSPAKRVLGNRHPPQLKPEKQVITGNITICITIGRSISIRNPTFSNPTRTNKSAK